MIFLLGLKRSLEKLKEKGRHEVKNYLKNPCQVRHFVISLSILIAAGSIFERRLK